MDERRLSAAEAFERVDQSGVFQANEAICRRAHDGVLTARAEVLFWNKEKSEDCEIPQDFWWARGNTALKQNWPAGDFETWIGSSIHCRAYGVSFLESDIVKMIPAAAEKGASIGWDENQFLASADTIEGLCKKVPCEKAVAESETVRWCKAGLLTSRCAKISWTETDRYGSTEYDDEGVSIPEWFWESCSDDPETIFDWQSGKIAGRGFDDDFTYKVKIEGVEFHRNEIAELEADLKSRLTPHETEQSDSGTSSRPGRKRSSAWNDWIAELAIHLHEKGFPDGTGAEGQDELIAAVEARMAEGGLECLSRSSVQLVARAVLLRYRSAKN